MKKSAKKYKPTSKHEAFSVFSQKAIRIIFAGVASIVLFIVLFFGWRQYCFKNNLVVPNIVLLICSLILSLIIVKLFQRKDFTQRQFVITIISVFAALFIMQLIIILFAYFYTDWDAGLANSLADQSVSGTEWSGDGYLSMYPNNIILIAIMKAIKSIPLLGSHYVVLLAISALCVNLAGLFTCLTIKELSSKKSAVLSTIIIALLVVLNPWFMIPYSDAFAILIPILMFYIYVKNKKWWRFAIISAMGVVGYFIKPTVAIMLIAIFAIEIITKKPKITKTLIKRALFVGGAITYALLLKPAAAQYIGFRQNPSTEPISFVHYLAMGQNEQTCGAYLQEDVDESRNGTEFEFNKFCNRIAGRSFGENVDFFAKKTLVNFNDGTFAWGREGTLFYARVPERNNFVTDIISDYYYSNGQNYKIFSYIRHTLWIFVLFFAAFLFFKNKNNGKEKCVLALALLGATLFVTLFEARARYLYCYAPIFIVCAVLGYRNLCHFVAVRHKGKKLLHR